MIIEGNLIIAEEGFFLKRKYDNQLVGKQYLLGYLYYRDGILLSEPYLEVPDDYTEVSESDVYGETVNDLIRRRYSLSDELALHRQRDEKPKEFQEYYEYCEECKKEAKEIINELY